MKKYEDPIYKNTHVNMQAVEKLKPLIESAFANQLGNLAERPEIRQERLNFAAIQYANRCRVAANQGANPLFEDAAIFGHLTGNGSVKQFFESVSVPGNITSSPSISNPVATSTLPGQTWNPMAQPGSGDAGSHVFGLQGHLALQCKGFDLIPMIAVDTPKVVTNFIDEVYGGGDLDSTEALPSFLKFGNKSKLNFKFSEDLVRSKSRVVFATDKTDADFALEVLFILAQTEEPKIVARVLSTGTIVAGVYTPGDVSEMTVEEAIDGINDETVTAPVALAFVDGDLTGAAVETALEPGALTAGYTSATRTNISEATTNTGTKEAMHRKQHKKGPQFKINLISLDKSIEMIGREIEADTENLQIRDFAAINVNVVSRLYNTVHNVILQTLDEDILEHIYALGVEHAYKAYQASGENYSLYIGKPSVASRAMTEWKVPYVNMMGEDVKADMDSVENSILSSQYENQTTHADRLFARILLVAEFVAYQNRIAPPDFLIAGGTVLAALKKASTYTIVPTSNSLSSGAELNYTGEVMGLRVYNNNKVRFDDPRICIGRRGNDSDPGAKFLAYDLASSAQTTAEQTMSAKIRVWSRYNIVDVGFHPELNYYTFLVHNDSKWA